MPETSIILLNSEKIKCHLNQQSIYVEIFDSIDSTNDYLKKHIPNNTKTRVCLAESMTKGKGRLDRQWHAPFGQNIYFSQLTPFQKNLNELSGLSLVVSLAVCKTIESTIDIKQKIFVKWPNDVLVNYSKLSGILIETQIQPHDFCQAIIGIGINVNMLEADKKNISQPWTSLSKLTGQFIDRNILCATLINVLDEYLTQFIDHGLAFFREEWQQRDALLHKNITLLSGNTHFSGIGAGINDQGQLLLNRDQKIKAFSSGDTTLLK
jgi:BirA family biotin operon repressor/biotin-[acetyl-CoA-carboxylase] ligase